MRAPFLTILVVWALSVGACIWALFFDGTLRGPVVGPATPITIATDKTASVPRLADAAARAGPPSGAAADGAPVPAYAPAKLDPVPLQPVSAPTAAPTPAAPLVYDAFGKTPPDPAEAERARANKEARLEALRAEFSADASAFGSRHGLTPEQVQLIQAGKLPLEWVQQNAYEKQ